MLQYMNAYYNKRCENHLLPGVAMGVQSPAGSLFKLIFWNYKVVHLSKNDLVKYSPLVKTFIADLYRSKLNGLQRGAKYFFGKLDTDEKKLKM